MNYLFMFYAHFFNESILLFSYWLVKVIYILRLLALTSMLQLFFLIVSFAIESFYFYIFVSALGKQSQVAGA